MGSTRAGNVGRVVLEVGVLDDGDVAVDVAGSPPGSPRPCRGSPGARRRRRRAPPPTRAAARSCRRSSRRRRRRSDGRARVPRPVREPPVWSRVRCSSGRERRSAYSRAQATFVGSPTPRSSSSAAPRSLAAAPARAAPPRRPLHGRARLRRLDGPGVGCRGRGRLSAAQRGRLLRRHAVHAGLLRRPRRARAPDRRAARLREAPHAASAAGLVVLVLVLLRRRDTPWPLAIGLAGALVASWAATSTVFGIRGDALAVLLQLGAVALVAERVTTGRAAAAGVLSGLALFVKLSALWAPAAIVVWLALRSRRALLPFARRVHRRRRACCSCLFEAVSSGRLHENLRSFAFAGSGGESALQGARRLFELAVRDQRSLWPILAARGRGRRTRARASPRCLRAGVPGGRLHPARRAPRPRRVREPPARRLGARRPRRRRRLVVARPAPTTNRLSRACAVAAVLLATALAARHTLVPDLRAALEDRDDEHASPRSRCAASSPSTPACSRRIPRCRSSPATGRSCSTRSSSAGSTRRTPRPSGDASRGRSSPASS